MAMLLTQKEGEDHTTHPHPPSSCIGTLSAKVAMFVNLESDLPLNTISDDNPRNHPHKDQEVRAQKQKEKKKPL